jgi:hypothetical protein
MSLCNSTTSVNPRAQCGAVLAQDLRITRKENGWIVPSQSGKGKYTVDAD